MKIVVPVKRVADPDNANKVNISSDSARVTSEGLEWKMNPFDEWSLEAALRLTEDAGGKKRVGEVVVVSIGPEDTTQTLRQGLAMGAERGVLVEGSDEALDSQSVAQILAAVVKKESPDLVLLGKQTVDGDSNVAGTLLAELLEWPLCNYASTITTADGGKTLTVERELDTGLATLKITGPAVITTSDRILQPEAIKNGVTAPDFKYPESDAGRYASLKGIMAAKKKPIEKLTIADLGVETTVVHHYESFALPPARSGSTTFVESVEDLVQRLSTEARVL